MDRREALKAAAVGAIAGILSKQVLGAKDEASADKCGEMSEHEKELAALDRAHRRAIDEHRYDHTWPVSTSSTYFSRLS